MSRVSTGFNENMIELHNLVYGVFSAYQQKLVDKQLDVQHIKALSIKELRKDIDRIERIVNKDSRFDLNTLEQMNSISKKLNKLIETANKNIELSHDLGIVINKSKIGTLQGLARDTMEQEKLEPHPEDEIAINFLKEWDEYRNNHGGGCKRSTA